jgi:hypothetical protein
MKEALESPLPIVIIKEWVWIAMEITIRFRLLADSYSLFVIGLPRASKASLRGYSSFVTRHSLFVIRYSLFVF